MDPIYFNIFEPSEWIRYIAVYFNLPSECDIWPADKPPIYLLKSFISIVDAQTGWWDAECVYVGKPKNNLVCL